MKFIIKVIIFLLIICFTFSYSQLLSDERNPIEYTYISRDSIDLKLYVFVSQIKMMNPNSAIVIFHGGGWAMGEASWGFSLAKYFSENGITGISVQYRLSDEKNITPLDAIKDACDAITWIRTNAKKLTIDPSKIAAYGWSAGAHLAVCAAIYDTSANYIKSSPNALILESPAVSLLGDSWPRRLLLGKEHIKNISPDELVQEGLPPCLILQGDLDTVTPLSGAERFYRKMLEKGNRCELKVYNGYGHLFTPYPLPDNGWPKSDPKIKEDIRIRSLDFLKSLNFIK